MTGKTRRQGAVTTAVNTKSTTGIRLNPSDKELLDKLSKPGETKADVIRRALRELERREWVLAAQEEAEHIDAHGEDLDAEPDAW